MTDPNTKTAAMMALLSNKDIGDLLIRKFSKEITVDPVVFVETVLPDVLGQMMRALSKIVICETKDAVVLRTIAAVAIQTLLKDKEDDVEEEKVTY